MSVLETPRIYFKGQVSWDPITTNNDAANYDENDGETRFTTVADFRRQAIEQVTSPSAPSWNPHGTHRSSFFDTAVNGFDLGSGTATDDPFHRAPVELTGMLVDLEPYGSFSSQLFFDSLLLGVRGGYRIAAPRSARITARYINFHRNNTNKMVAGVASVVWQTAFAKADGLVVDAFDSPVLTALAEALDQDDVLGLTMRFNSYRTVYYDDDTLRNGSAKAKASAAKLQGDLKNQGGFQPNPARSLLVGVLGLWRQGEPTHEPGERVLLPLAAALATPPGTAQVMDVHAQVVGTDLVLDLGNSIPEVDQALTKQDLGPLSVLAGSTTLATLTYDQYQRDAYEASAGIVTLPLSAAALDAASTHDLHLDVGGKPLLVEASPRVIPDTPNLYLDEGEQEQVAFQVYERGRPVQGVRTGTLYAVDPNSGAIQAQAPVTTDAGGRFSQTLTAGPGRIVELVPAFRPADVPKPGHGIDPQVNTYMHVRVRPADAPTAALAPTWKNVFANVLANWNALAPCMDNWLRLDDQAQVRSMAGVLKRLTDPAAFESFRFMPVTRDMSVGQRALLYAFLDAAPEVTPPGQTTGTTPPPPATAIAFSRSLRGH